jgi:HlyD family secretion protein
MSDQLDLDDLDLRELESRDLKFRDLELRELESRNLKFRDRDVQKLESDAALPSNQLSANGLPPNPPPRRFRLPRLSGWQGILLGLLAGGILTTVVGKIASAPKAAAPTAATLPPSQSVSLETVQMGTIDQTVPTQGNVDARDWAAVIPQATGLQIQQIGVEEGQSVRAGQAVAQLDTSTLQDQMSEAKSQLNAAQAQLASARSQLSSTDAQLVAAATQRDSAQADVAQKEALLGQQVALRSQAENNLERYQKLQKQGAISQQDFEARSTTLLTAKEGVSVAQSNINAANAGVSRAEAGIGQAIAGRGQAEAGVAQAEAGIQTANARIQQLETKLAQATVRAPVSGTLTKKNPSNGKEVAQVGELAGSTPLFYVLDAGALDLQVKVPESLLAQIKVGASAQISSDADPRIKLTGNVREIAPVVNEQKQAIVKISLPSSEWLKPGMFLKAAVSTQTTQSLTIPDKALKLQADGSKIVFVLDQQNIAHAKPIEIGDPSNGRIPVKTGLKAGDRIVAQPGFVNDGDRIQVVN